MRQRKTLYCILVLSLIMGGCGSDKVAPEPAEAETVSGETSHLGGCILTAPNGEVPDDLYQVGEVMATDEFPPFTKKLSVYGIILIGREDISDEFMRKVAQTITEMFPQTEEMDKELQAEVLRNMYRYRTVIPLFAGEDFEFSPEDEQVWNSTCSQNSICDIIMQGVPGQTMEVVEHILHHVTDVGLHYTFPEEWGISQSSRLYLAMQEAIEGEFYEVEQYSDIDEAEVYNRVLLQEFAYWIITCAWDLQEPYGPKDAEWKIIRTKSQLQNELPLSFQLCEETLPRFMIPPSTATLEEFKQYEGQE